MPELPEVETIKNDLNRLVKGKEIIDVASDSPKQVKPSLEAIKKDIIGTKIKRIERRAKLIIITLSNQKILTIHLKMTGQLLVRKKSAPKDKYQHIVFKLKAQGARRKIHDLELRFCDLRKFGWVKLIKNKKGLEKEVAGFGPEAPELSVKEFEQILSKSTRSIKLLLLDQNKLSGIGNIYANDALWLAKIHPSKKANKLSQNEQKRLLSSVKKVLKAGIKYRGASDQYYLDALGHKGAYQEHFLVYNRAGKTCLGCFAKIIKVKVAGRGTYLCPKCQKEKRD